MLIYIILFFSLFLSLIIKTNTSFCIWKFNFSSLQLFRVFFLIMFILVSFRDLSVGTDTNHYDYGFGQIVNNEFNFSNNPYSAPLYYLLCYLCGYFTNNGISIRIIQAAVTYYCFYKLILKNSPSIFLSLFLFICYGYFAKSMNGSRHIMAISIALYSIYSFYFEKRRLLSLTLLLIAILIHIASAIVILIHFLNFFYRNQKSLTSIFLSSILVALIFNCMYKYGCYIISEYIVHYKIYTNEGERINIIVNNTSGVVAYLFMFYLSIILIYVHKVKVYPAHDFTKIILPFITIFSFWGLLNPFNEIIMRVILVSNMLLVCILMPNVVKFLKYKERVVYVALVIAASIFYFFYDLVLSNGSGVVPYTFISF